MDLMKDGDDDSLSIGNPSISSGNSGNTFVISSSSTSEPSGSQRSGSEATTTNFENLEDVLNTLHSHILEFCDNSLELQQKRDFLLLAINIIKNNDLLKRLTATDREDIECYIENIRTRLQSVNISIGCIGTGISNSLQAIDGLIEAMICFGNVAKTRRYCEQYLNVCGNLARSKDDESGLLADSERSTSTFISNFDDEDETIRTEFHGLLQGCKKRDRENIKRRLGSLMEHLNFQVSHLVK